MSDEVLDDTLRIVARCFKLDAEAVQRTAFSNLFLSGLATFLFKNQPNTDDLIAALTGKEAYNIAKSAEMESGASRKDAVPTLVQYFADLLANYTNRAKKRKTA